MAIESEDTKALTQDEHLEAAHAKRVVLRYLNPDDGVWYNFVPALVPKVDYDYVGITATSSTVDTLAFRDGGSGGALVRTITITYTSSGADKVSNSLSKIEFS